MRCERCVHWVPTYAPYVNGLVNTCNLPRAGENEERCRSYVPRKEARNVLSILQFVQVHAD